MARFPAGPCTIAYYILLFANSLLIALFLAFWNVQAQYASKVETSV